MGPFGPKWMISDMSGHWWLFSFHCKVKSLPRLGMCLQVGSAYSAQNLVNRCNGQLGMSCRKYHGSDG